LSAASTKAGKEGFNSTVEQEVSQKGKTINLYSMSSQVTPTLLQAAFIAGNIHPFSDTYGVCVSWTIVL
jgi:hypothetical protein